VECAHLGPQQCCKEVFAVLLLLRVRGKAPYGGKKEECKITVVEVVVPVWH